MALAEHFTQETQQTQKHYRILSDGSLCLIPDGADADFVVKIKEAALRNKAKTTSSRTHSAASSRNCKKGTNYAAQLLRREVATVQLVERVNKVEPDPTMDPNIITVHGAGGTWFMNRESGKVSYA